MPATRYFALWAKRLRFAAGEQAPRGLRSSANRILCATGAQSREMLGVMPPK